MQCVQLNLTAHVCASAICAGLNPLCLALAVKHRWLCKIFKVQTEPEQVPWLSCLAFLTIHPILASDQHTLAC